VKDAEARRKLRPKPDNHVFPGLVVPLVWDPSSFGPRETGNSNKVPDIGAV
jgi:hypothetical protein